jgi:molybdopterin molybdotransferase
MITVKEAKEFIFSSIVDNDTAIVSLAFALGSYIRTPVFSSINMPPFRQSAMDGYALCFHNSNKYELIDEVKAGDGHIPVLKEGQAIRIFTGAAVPDTANVVIMQEKVLTLSDTTIEIQKEVQLEENIRPLGEQVKIGELALPKGTKLTPAAIGYLASLGITEVSIYKKPKIAVVATGNELVEIGQELPYGKIYESNSIMLQSALKSTMTSDVTLHKVKDDYASTKELLAQVIADNDVVLISGGISVGDYDYVGKALLELEVNQIFYKVKQKPGKPLFFGTKGATSIFALPGNPAAALTCFYVYVLPGLNKMIGNPKYKTQSVSKISKSKFIKSGDRAQFLKAHIDGDAVSLLEGQSSAMLQTFALANALVFVPEEVMEIKVGDAVEVIQLPV